MVFSASSHFYPPKIMADRSEAGPAWASLPTALLQAELLRRQNGEKPVCGSGQRGTYNMPAHIFALILILVLSTVACAFPLVSRRAGKNPLTTAIVFYSQHFGTGVLIATAFVHLMPTAFVSLTDPCLAWFWSEGYRPMSGLMAMVSALTVVGIEQFLRTRGAGPSHSHGEAYQKLLNNDDDEDEDDHDHGLNGSTITKTTNGSKPAEKGLKNRTKDIALQDIDSPSGLADDASPLEESNSQEIGTVYHNENDGNDSDLDLDEMDPTTADIEHNDNPKGGPGHEEEQKRLLLQCLLLEAGILFHSVFIGMAVSVATGTPFVVFLIAISFHQTFEGLALGSRIAAIHFPRSSPRPWLMVLAYGTTTPFGQAIGLILHSLYDPHSEIGLLMVGTMNAISAGLLLFAGLVQLLSEDFLSDKSYIVLKGTRRLRAYLAVIAGSALMAFVGAWA